MIATNFRASFFCKTLYVCVFVSVCLCKCVQNVCVCFYFFIFVVICVLYFLHRLVVRKFLSFLACCFLSVFAQVGKINATKHKVNHVYKANSPCCTLACPSLETENIIWGRRKKKTFRPEYYIYTFENWKLWWWWNAAKFFMLNHNFCAHPAKHSKYTNKHTRTLFFRANLNIHTQTHWIHTNTLTIFWPKNGIKANTIFCSGFGSTRKLKRLHHQLFGMSVAKY